MAVEEFSKLEINGFIHLVIPSESYHGSAYLSVWKAYNAKSWPGSAVISL